MKLIPLTQGYSAMVDEDDFEWLNQWKWYYKKGYAVRNITIGKKKQTTLRMHRVILNTPKGMKSDHEDLDKLNNQRYNLRICNNAQNGMNRAKLIQPNGASSKYKGVSFDRSKHAWIVQITYNKKKKWVGTFHNEIEAARAWDQEAIKYHGEFAVLNNV